MEETGKIVVLITAASEEEAQSIAKLLLEQKKAACVNIVPGVDSHFWWKGKLEEEKECLLIVKSTVSLLPAIIKTVKKAHSYEVPEIIALPIVGGNEDYLKWIDDEVRET